MKHLSTIILAGLLGASAPGGCSAPPPPEEAPPPRKRKPPSPGESGDVVAVGVGRHLIYQGQWSRADDLAYSLQPIVEGIYGPAARVVAHGPSNKLFIYIPTPREREAAAGRAAGAGGAPRVQPQPGQGVVPQPGATQGSSGRRTPRRAGMQGGGAP